MALQNNGQVIKNDNLKTIGQNCFPSGYTFDAAYTYDAAAKTVAVDNQSTIPGTDAYKRFKAKVHDMFGNEVVAQNATGADLAAFDVSALNTSKPLALTVTISTDDGIIADGAAYGLQAAGDIAHWDSEQNAANEL